MNYNININQVALITHFPDLDLFDATILTYLQGLLLSPSTKLKRLVIDERIYTWVHIPTVYTSLPILKKHIKSESKGWLSTRLSKLKESGLILKHIDRKTQQLFVCFTEEIEKLVYKSEPAPVHTEEPTVHGEEPYRSYRRTNYNTIEYKTKYKKYINKYTFFENEDFCIVWEQYERYRKKMTEGSKILNLNKLTKLSNGDVKVAIDVVNQSIERCWTGLFPVNKSSIPKTMDTQYDKILTTVV